MTNDPNGMIDSKAQQALVEMRAALEGCRRTTEPVMRLLLGYGGRSAVLIADAVHRADTRARTALDTATSVIEAGLGEDGWRTDMDKAPKWGGTILPPYILVFNGHHIGVGYRDEPYSEGDPEFVDEDGEFIEPPPTHWRPLPAAPTSPSTKEPQS